VSGRGRAITLVAVATMTLAGCGGSSDDEAPVANTAAAPVAASAVPSAAAGKGKPAAPAATSAVPAAATEQSSGVTGISAADAAKTKSALEQAEAESAVAWEGPTLKALGDIDARLIADRALALKRVRTSCAQINGLFSDKAIKLLQETWRDKTITISEDMGAAIYDVLIYEACPKI
jgi:hypothetical protein